MTEPHYGMIGQSEAMLRVFKDIDKITEKGVGAPLFIVGETGTGKELVAKAIHDYGARQKGRFFPVDSSCINGEIAESLLFGHTRGSFTGAMANQEGYFQAARRGTLFLDEIGNLPLSIQAKLLRALEYGYTAVGSHTEEKADFQLITASNRSLTELVRTGEFREDLYYRIAGHTISLPPLRERRGDVEVLADYFLEQYNTGMEISPAAMNLLNSYYWPGNVRQLRNVMEIAVIKAEGTVIEAGDIESQLEKTEGLEGIEEEITLTAIIERAFPSSDPSKLPTLDQIERCYTDRVLKATGYSKTDAAKILKISIRTLQHWAKCRSE